MNNEIVTFATLKTLCAPDGPDPSAVVVRRWAAKQGIAFKVDRAGGIFTTVAALNAALGVGNTLPDRTAEDLV